MKNIEVEGRCLNSMCVCFFLFERFDLANKPTLTKELLLRKETPLFVSKFMPFFIKTYTCFSLSSLV